jgi:O-antigen ligase
MSGSTEGESVGMPLPRPKTRTETGTTQARALPGTARFRRKETMISFFLLLAYLFLEYGRPQELLPFLRELHLPGIAIVLLALSLVVSGNLRLKERQAKVFMVLLGLMVLQGPIAVNNYWALMIFVTMSMNFVVFLALTAYVDDPEKYDRLVNLWIAIHVFLAIVGIFKKGKGIGGFLDDENDFCMTMNMILPFPFFLALNASGKRRISFIGLTLLFLFVIILTNSRGGFVGLVATSLYCWLRTKNKILTGAMMAALVLFALLAAPATYWKEVRSITEEGASKGTGEERVYTWKVGWDMFLQHPVIGVGQGNFPWVFKKYENVVAKEGYHGRSVAGRAAHSIYFTMLPELGIFGTCLILAMIFGIYMDVRAVKRRSWGPKRAPPNPLSDRNYAMALALEGALVSYLVSGAFISVLYYPNLWVLMGFAVALRRIAVPDPAKPGV